MQASAGGGKLDRLQVAAKLGGEGSRLGLVGELLQPAEARVQHLGALRSFVPEDGDEPFDGVANARLVVVLEQLHVHVLIVGERVAGAKDGVGRLRDGDPPLGERELREQPLELALAVGQRLHGRHAPRAAGSDGRGDRRLHDRRPHAGRRTARRPSPADHVLIVPNLGRLVVRPPRSPSGHDDRLAGPPDNPLPSYESGARNLRPDPLRGYTITARKAAVQTGRREGPHGRTASTVLPLPERRATRSIARYPFLELREHDVLDPGATTTRIAVTVSLRDWVVVVARAASGELVLVEQYRHGVDRLTLEPAGGIIDPGEEPAKAALRELVEETGYGLEGAEPELLATVHPNPALSENTAFLFLVRGVQKLKEPEDHVDERTRVVLLDAATALCATRDGRISHALGVLAIVLASSRP